MSRRGEAIFPLRNPRGRLTTTGVDLWKLNEEFNLELRPSSSMGYLRSLRCLPLRRLRVHVHHSMGALFVHRVTPSRRAKRLGQDAQCPVQCAISMRDAPAYMAAQGSSVTICLKLWLNFGFRYLSSTEFRRTGAVGDYFAEVMCVSVKTAAQKSCEVVTRWRQNGIACLQSC
jgi:hypothetical protein